MNKSFYDIFCEGIVFYNNVGKITAYNKAFCDIYGVSEKELISSKITVLFSKSEFKADLKTLTNLTDEKKYLVEIETKNADKKKLEITFNNCKDNEGFIAIVCDKTDKKLDEIQEEYNHKMSNLNSFLSIVGHDVRNVISQFMSLSEIMIEKYDDFSKEEIKRYLVMMNKASVNGFELMERLIKWARLVAERESLEYSKFNLNDLILKVIKSEQENLDAKNIKIIFEQKDLFVSADYNLIFQAFQNVINNAIKFSQFNSEIKIKLSKSGNDAEVEIIDYGKGMSQEAIEYLFKTPFKYIQRSTNGKAGFGIGMLIVSEIIKKHKGRISVKSNLDKGTIVNIKLKLSDTFELSDN